MLDYGAVPLGALFLTPVLISQLGIEQYGLLALATTLVAFNAVFGFGFGDTALKYVSQYLRNEERAHARQVVRTVSFLAMVSGLLVGVLVGLGAAPLATLLRVSDMPDAMRALTVTAAIMPFRLTESVYVAVLRGCFRYDIAGAITVMVKVGTIAAQIALVINGATVSILLLATLGFVVASNVVLFAACSMLLGNVVPGFVRETFSEIRHFSVWSWMQGLAGLVYSNADRLLIAALLGPSALGLYGACMQLAQNIHSGLAAAAHSLFPYVSMVSGSFRKGDAASDESLRRAYVRASRGMSVIAVTTGSLIAVFSYEILDVWLGPTIADEGAFLLGGLSVSFAWFAANSIVVYYTMNGLGLARVQAGISAGGAGVMGASTTALTVMFGLPGAALARLPDALFRSVIRAYVGRTIIGRVPIWASLDFARITLITFVGGHLVRHLVLMGDPTGTILRSPANLLVVGLAGVFLLAVNAWIEGAIIGTLETSET